MTCNTLVLWKEVRRKGNSKPYRKVVRYAYPGMTEEDKVGFELCSGKIIASIQVYDEPDWGDHHAVLEISYQCDTCRSHSFPQLPHDIQALSNFVTEAIGVK